MFLVNQRTIRRFILIYTSLIPFTFLYGNSPSPPLGKTGAPGNGSCAECHTDKGPANPGHVILDVGRLAYLPGVKQTVRIHILPQRDMPLTGFQLTARLESGTLMQAGHFESSSNTTVQLLDGIEYVSNSVSEPQEMAGGFQVSWTPPAADAGSVRFYAVAVAGHPNRTPEEAVYSTSFSLPAGTKDLPSGYRWETFSVPGATRTYPGTLLDDGKIRGSYESGQGLKPYIRNKDGSIQKPDSLDVYAMNSVGTVVGPSSPSSGFVREAGGTTKTISVEGATNLLLTRINDSGAVAGQYTKDGKPYLLRAKNPPQFESFHISGKLSADEFRPQSLTEGGYILARRYFYDPMLFLISPDNSISGASICRTVDIPSYSPFLFMNDDRLAVGWCGHEFIPGDYIVLAPNGRLLKFQRFEGVSLFSINNAGQITGDWNDQATLLTPCQITPQSTTLSAPSAGGHLSIPAGSAVPDCRPNVSGTVPWITPDLVQEPRSIRFRIASNNSPLTRTATLWAAGRDIAIKQAPGVCSMPDLLLTTWSFPSRGGTMEFRSVWTQPEGCPWNIATSSSWLSGSSRRQDGDFLSISAAPNPDPSPRTGTISFSGHIITITQAQNCTYQVSPTNIDIPARGGFIPVQVTTPPGCTWTYSRNGDANWYSSGASENNTGSLSFFIGAGENNWAFTRTGSVTVAGRTLHVQQPTPISGLRFLPIAPCRVADTRGGANVFDGPPQLAANQPRWINLGYSGCRQGDDAPLAYSLNVTVVPNTTLSYLTAYPYNADRPFVSTLNSFNGRVVANAAIVPSGYNYSLQLFATDPTHAIVDVNGYFVKDTDPRGLAFYPLTPCRAADTRLTTGPRAGTTVFPLASIGCGVPVNAAAYSLNVTSVPSGPLPYLTLWPTGIAQPVVSTLNAFDGQVVANAAIVAAGVSSSVSVFNAAPSDTILDVNGYFAPPGAPGALRFFPVHPCRVADTRSNSGMPGPFGAPQVPAGGSREIPIPQSACGIPPTAKAYALNVTAVPPGPLGYVTAWPSGLPRPTVSTLNSFDGQVVANAAIVPAGTNGAVMFYASSPTDLVIDINGYFAP